jgi:hypothetical protein
VDVSRDRQRDQPLLNPGSRRPRLERLHRHRRRRRLHRQRPLRPPRPRPNGDLWLYPGTGNPARPFLARIHVGHGWNGYNSLIATGDLDGSGHPALLASDASGDLWMYQGTGNASGPFAPRVLISSGWGAYNTFA